MKQIFMAAGLAVMAATSAQGQDQNYFEETNIERQAVIDHLQTWVCVAEQFNRQSHEILIPLTAHEQREPNAEIAAIQLFGAYSFDIQIQALAAIRVFEAFPNWGLLRSEREVLGHLLLTTEAFHETAAEKFAPHLAIDVEQVYTDCGLEMDIG